MSLLTLALNLLLASTPTVENAPAPAYVPTLSSFSSNGSGKHSVLAWTLAPASKVAYVIVQRQGDAPGTWAPVANRPVTGATHYSFQPTAQRAGTYRLVTVDYDGTPAFSQALTIR